MVENSGEHRHHRHHRNRENRFWQLVRRFRFEIIWFIVIVCGIFLIFERMSIRSTILRWLSALASGLIVGLDRLDSAVSRLMGQLSLADRVGLLLVLGALIVGALRLRWQLMHTSSLVKVRCPKCGSEIHRVHRHGLDRAINLYVPVRRYRCANRECRWDGLRVDRPDERPRSRHSSSSMDSRAV